MPVLVTSGVSNDGQVRQQIMSVMNIQKPEIRTQLMRVFNDQGIPFIEQVRSMGYERQISQYSTQTYEDTDNRQYITVSGTTQMPSSGNSYTAIFTLSAAAYTPQPSYLPFNVFQSLFQYNQSSPYTAGQYAIPVQLNDLLMFQENNSVGQITAITGGGTNTVTISVQFPQAANGYTITTSLSSGTAVPFMGNAFSENSGQPNTRFFALGLDTHYLQLYKATSSISGDQMTNQLWVDQWSGNGKSIGSYKEIGDMKTDYLFAKEMSDILLFGNGGGYSFYLDPTTGKEPNQFTEGLIPYVKRRGLSLQYVAGSPLLPYIEQESLNALQNYASRDRMIWCGYQFDNQISSELRQANANTGVNFISSADDYAVDTYLKGSRKLSYDLNWASFSFNATYKYYLCSLNELNYIDKYNTNLLYSAIITPMGTKMVKTSSGGGDQALPYIGLIYKGLGSYSRLTEIWDVSGAGGNTGSYNSSVDARNLYHRAHFGGEHVGGNQMTYMYV